MTDIEPCPRCHRNRWRTVIKRLAWACRRCGYLRGTAES
jgi:ribosomal protein L37AE/L43A